MKYLKIILGLALILFIGHLINTWSLTSEESKYVYIQTAHQNGLSSISIKKVPSSICEKQLARASKETVSSCENCNVEVRKCLSEVESEFIGIFENKHLSFPYVSIDYKYPERHIIIDLPDDGFDKFCNMMKKKHPKAVCVQ